jgi:hypothetical protein
MPWSSFGPGIWDFDDRFGGDGASLHPFLSLSLSRMSDARASNEGCSRATATSDGKVTSSETLFLLEMTVISSLENPTELSECLQGAVFLVTWRTGRWPEHYAATESRYRRIFHD